MIDNHFLAVALTVYVFLFSTRQFMNTFIRQETKNEDTNKRREW